MVTDDDGQTAVEKRIADFLSALTASGPYTPPRPSSVPSFAQHVRTQDELEQRREQVRRARALRRRAELDVAADVRKRLNATPDRVTLHPMS